MTKVRFHGPIAGFSGAMGEMVFADQVKKGRTVAYMKTHYAPTETQMYYREQFKAAAAHAKAMLANPAAGAFYEAVALARESNPYLVAITDFLVKPRFEPLDLSEYRGQIGDTILIRAVDDIGLTDVDVTLSANDGTQIETGKAVEDGVHTGHWTYTATTPVPLGTDIFIEVFGFDHAGTKAEISESPRVGQDE